MEKIFSINFEINEDVRVKASSSLCHYLWRWIRSHSLLAH